MAESTDNIEHRCVLIKTNGDLEEVKVVLSDKEAVKKLVGGDAEYKGEMEGRQIAILGSKETEGMEKNDLGFELSPPCDNVCGTVLAFLVGVNGKPIDLSISQYKRSKKNLRKKQNANNQKEEETTTKESNGDAEDEEVDESDKNQTEVHLQGLPYDTTEETIREFLGECGTIKEVRIPTYQDSGRCRGYAFVSFTNQAGARAALKKNKEYIGERYITISYSNNRNDTIPVTKKDVMVPIDCRCIFVKNLPYDVTEEEIRAVFMRFGKISEVRIPVWNDTGRQKGLCYVDYLTNQSVKLAVAQSGAVEMKGRKLLIDVESGSPKDSFRMPDGNLWKNEHKGERRKRNSQGKVSSAGKKAKKELSVC